MKKLQDYNELIGKGVDYYLSILKDNDLYEEVTQRIKRKNGSEPNTLIKQIFENQSNFSEYLFSDLTYSLDDFYEGFEFNLKRVIELSFQDLNYDYQIITDFYDWQTREKKASIPIHSNEKYTEANPELWASLENSFKKQWRIVLDIEGENHVFNWVDFGEENIVNFLNCINDICEKNDNQFKWFPIVSSYSSNFIFTTEQHYNSIVDLNLMPPEGYEIDEVAIVHYPKGIIAASQYKEEILPISNISCEVPVGGKEYIIYVKLWRKSKEGNLDIREIPGIILNKLKNTSAVCNRMNWDYGKIVLDANKILSDNEVDEVVVNFTEIIRKAVQDKSIDLKNKSVSIFKNDENYFLKSIEIQTDDNNS